MVPLHQRMKFRDGFNLTLCGKLECGRPVTDKDKSSENCWFLDFSELNHPRELCAAKLKDSGEICAICAAKVPKLQIFHHTCPRIDRYKWPRE